MFELQLALSGCLLLAIALLLKLSGAGSQKPREMIREVNHPRLPGKAMDVRPVCDRISHVREDYLALAVRHAHHRESSERIHTATRAAVRQLAYFQRAKYSLQAEAESQLA